jgi:hypothetical protein
LRKESSIPARRSRATETVDERSALEKFLKLGFTIGSRNHKITNRGNELFAELFAELFH